MKTMYTVEKEKKQSRYGNTKGISTKKLFPFK